MMTSRKRGKSWAGRRKDTAPVLTPVQGLEGVFVRPPTFGQLKRLRNLSADEGDVSPIIEFLWREIVVDADNNLWDVGDDEVDVAELNLVQDAIEGLCKGEAPGTPGDKPKPT